MKKTNLEAGDGVNKPKKGDTLGVHYTGTLNNGSIFDCSRQRKSLFEFQVGMGNVIKGWDNGLLGFTLGERTSLEIPPNMAYGASGVPPTIPPNATLKFDVQLFSINGRFFPGPDGRRRCGSCLIVEETKGTFQGCGACRSVFYCGRECQRAHWPSHKKFCPTLKKARISDEE